ncbi:hypothetical protein J1N10_16935 [Carboxylicivirga sp. A043]|uniref:DUF6340 family protein n=1 Tax=Carboxylicivirga litoralis TaxID=2816963 RepID=UPI0021CAF3FD|nr:DUF6340 family protein [Carboxylicivirga sp. A043]MCU4157664.1 hypothetical protein [Carboxylicivirga sp. A043]
MIKKCSIYLLFLLVLVSCKSYELMHYDVLRPANYSVPPQIKSIVIVDNAYPFNPDNAHIAQVMGEDVRLDTVRVDTITTVIINQLYEDLNLRRFFDTVYVDTLKYNTEEFGKPMQQLSQGQIIDICNKHNADALLSLDAAVYGTKIEVHDMEVEYYATMDVYSAVNWHLFDGYSSEALYQTSQQDTLYWNGVGVDVQSSVSSFPSLKEATVEVGHYLGATFVDKLVPYWEPVTRKLYISGNPQFVNAAEWLSKDERYEAEKLWGFVYEHGNSREKGKAANNIALSMEARGEFFLAMEWAYKSYQAFQTHGVVGNAEERRTSRELYVDLVRRYRDQKKLDEQLGPQ